MNRFPGLLLTFVVLRSVFLGSLENPEPRYTLEGYPVVIILAAVPCQARRARSDSQSTTRRRIAAILKSVDSKPWNAASCSKRTQKRPSAVAEQLQLIVD